MMEVIQLLRPGTELGFMLLLAPVAVTAAWIYRSPLLLLSSAGIGVQFLISITTKAHWQTYAEHFSWLLPWQAGLMTLSFLLVFACLHRLLQLNRQPRYLLLLAWSYCLGGMALLLQAPSLFAHYQQMLPVLLTVIMVLCYCHQVRPQALTWVFIVPLILSGAAFQGSAFGLLFTATLLLAMCRYHGSRQGLQQQLNQQQQQSLEHLERTVAARTRQLTRSLTARDQMLARISHDLRSPLGHIIARAEHINHQNYAQETQYIVRIAHRQLELLDELIAYARDELKQQELAVEPQYLYAFIKELEEEGRLLSRHHHNQFYLQLGEHLPALVQCDVQKLRRIVVNLLDNAAKFTHDGKITLTLTSTDLPANKIALQVAVTDTGPGISPELRQRLDQPYQRGEHKMPGYGLGLAIVSELLQQMDSHLVTEQPDSGGSRFRFELILEKAREYDIDQVFIERRVKDVDGSRFNVLLVDDIALTCTYLSELLGGYGFDTLTAFSVCEAMHHVQHEHIDLVVTDQLMPDKSGWELLEQLRRQYPKLPVLLYSALPPRPEQHQAHLSFDETLLKPADSDEFLQTVYHLCSRHLHSAL
ncbi:ATP-binding response regulator [Oceanimonas smirnovii]|uniref:ATP-binding response regulator n=1 Tax=Oceanimonas smirnovii TaxID=264574 RepID=UPI003FD2B41F